MKKIVILLVIAAAGYLCYQNYGFIMAKTGLRSNGGAATVLLFTTDACVPCSEVAGELRKRDIAFEELNVMTDEGRSRFSAFGETVVPLVVIGSARVVGNNIPQLESALAEANGMGSLSSDEKRVMNNHFNEQGKPRVVMYGMNWCPYCKRMRAYLDGRHVPYLFADVEGDRGAKADYDILHGRGYPLKFVGFRRIDGYDENRVDQAVKDLL